MRFVIVALLSTLLLSCASPGPVGTAPGIVVADLSELPRPALLQEAAVRPGDGLRVAVLGFPELSRELQVDPTGTFEFPLIGTVQASGQLPSEIAQEIEGRLRGPYVVAPDATIDVTERESRLITVSGQVNRPGRYPVTSSMTLLDAMAMGGGASELAQMNEVLILRTVDGQRYIGVYDLGAIQRGNYANPSVYPEDIVVMGDSPTRRRLANIMALSPLLTTPLIVIDRLLR